MSRNDDDKKYWDDSRFNVPERLREFASRYDMPSQNIQDLNQRRVIPFTKYIIDLSAAKTAADPFVIQTPGRGFVCYGFIASTLDTYKTVSSNIIVNVRVGQNLPECEWSAKHNRGFRGDFDKLYLYWPQQVGTMDAAVSAEFYVFKFDGQPYMGGESAT